MYEQFLISIGFIKTYDSAITEMRHKTDKNDYLYQTWELEKADHNYYLLIRKNTCELSYLEEDKNSCDFTEEIKPNKIIVKFKLRSLKFMLKRHII